MYRAGLAILALTALVACGGGGSSTSNGGNNNGGGGSGGGGGAANPPVVVSVSSGTTAGGVDITLPAPASSPAPNATLLGAATVPASGGSVSITLTNGFTNIHQGSQIIIAVSGTGISANTSPTISGPDDINIDLTTLKEINLESGEKGVSFQATVTSSAALGARTVLLKNAQDDITAFAGGLQVVP